MVLNKDELMVQKQVWLITGISYLRSCFSEIKMSRDELCIQHVQYDWTMIDPGGVDPVHTYNILKDNFGSSPVRPAGGDEYSVHEFKLDIHFEPLRITFGNGVSWMRRIPLDSDKNVDLLSICNSAAPFKVKIVSVGSDTFDIIIEQNHMQLKLCFHPCKRLIISSGDISDVDGLYALAKYANTGADVLFVMNYPAYVGTGPDNDVGILSPGEGYEYGVESYLAAFDGGFDASGKKTEKYLKYKELVDEKYADIVDISSRVKQMFTDLAFKMVSDIWCDVNVSGKGKLFFCVGGVNSFNPFAKSSLKNEMYVYSDYFESIKALPSCKEGVLFDDSGCECGMSISNYVGDHRDIYIDFNGSMAFLDRNWINALNACKNVIRGAFVMGGVFSYAEPCTLPRIEGVLNRFSCATMNQLYHPERTALFFRTMQALGVILFVVSNNAVGTQETFEDPEKKKKTDIGWERFFDMNLKTGNFLSSLDGSDSILKSLARVYYNSKYNPPRRAFDFYTAVALVARMSALDIGEDEFLFFDNKFGIALISGKRTWREAVADYSEHIDTSVRPNDIPFIMAKKMNLSLELMTLNSDVMCDNPISIRNIAFNDTVGAPLRVSVVRRFKIQDVGCWQILSNPRYVDLFKRLTDHDLNTVETISLTVVLRESLDRVSVQFKNGLKLNSDIPVDPGGSGSGISYTADWREFIKYYDESHQISIARFKSFYSDSCELELESKGNLVEMVALGGDNFSPVKTVTVSFKL